MSRLSDVELAAWQALLHAHHDLTNRLDAELRANHEITLGDYDVLVRLARADRRRLTMTELSRRAMIPPSSVTRVVDRLVKRGLVSRERSDSDTRVVHAQLTADGHVCARAAARTHLRGIREHFTRRLTAVDLEAVARALERIVGPHQPH